eukprot:gene31350-38726_t
MAKYCPPSEAQEIAVAANNESQIAIAAEDKFIQELQNNLSASQVESDILRAQITQWGNQCGSLECALNVAMTEIESLQNTIASMQSSAQEVQKTHQVELRSSRDSATSFSSRLTALDAYMTETVNALENELSDAHICLDAAVDTIAELTDSMAEAEQELSL